MSEELAIPVANYHVKISVILTVVKILFSLQNTVECHMICILFEWCGAIIWYYVVFRASMTDSNDFHIMIIQNHIAVVKHHRITFCFFTGNLDILFCLVVKFL